MTRAHSRSVLLALLIGCKGDEPGDSPSVEDTAGVPGAPALTFADGTVDRDHLDAGTAPGLLWLPNIDDDDANGASDWDDYGPSGDDDYAEIVIPAATFQSEAGRHSVNLSLAGDLENIRVWHDAQVVLGEGGLTTFQLGPFDGDVSLWVELGASMTRGSLVLEDTSSGDVLELWLTAPPMVMNHHLQPSEVVWSMPSSYWSYSNAEMMAVYEEVLGEQFIPVSQSDYDYDVWVQDEFEMATMTIPGRSMDVVWDTIRDRGLDPMPEEMIQGPGHALQVWGEGWGTAQDYGGNLEASPPVTVDGVTYPFGRIYYGAEGNAAPHEDMMAMMDAQRIQEPFVLDSSWLCVGHVDEWFTFVPDAASAKGFKLVYSDVDVGYALMEAMDPKTVLTKYADVTDYVTVADLLADKALRALNEDLRDNILEPQLEILKAELGLEDADIIRYPQLFEEPQGCGSWLAALQPGMSNLIIADVEGVTNLFIPDPFMRADVLDQKSDPFIAFMRANLGKELVLHFVDDWEVYHTALGEVHCGTNVQRDPVLDWWTESSWLLEGER